MRNNKKMVTAWGECNRQPSPDGYRVYTEKWMFPMPSANLFFIPLNVTEQT